MQQALKYSIINSSSSNNNIFVIIIMICIYHHSRYSNGRAIISLQLSITQQFEKQYTPRKDVCINSELNQQLACKYVHTYWVIPLIMRSFVFFFFLIKRCFHSHSDFANNFGKLYDRNWKPIRYLRYHIKTIEKSNAGFNHRLIFFFDGYICFQVLARFSRINFLEK